MNFYEQTKVLDHGYVRYIDHMGNEEGIIEAARMSTGKGFLGWDPTRCCVKCGIDPNVAANSRSVCVDQVDHRWADTKGDANLLEFLYRNEHLTPFEMCELHVEVYAPIFVFREWHRHRTFSYNEFSARYAQMPNEHYVPSAERFKSVSSANKQANSSSPVGLKVEKEIDAEGWQKLAERQQRYVYAEYDSMIMAGVPKEVARINTPVSRYSKMRAKTDLRNWLGFLKLRMAPSAQLEIREYAYAVYGLMKQIWPRTIALFDEYTRGAVTLSATEATIVRRYLDPDGVAMNSDGDVIDAVRERCRK